MDTRMYTLFVDGVEVTEEPLRRHEAIDLLRYYKGQGCQVDMERLY